MFDLSTLDIKYLNGVGPQRASILNKELGVYTLLDLLRYYPYKHIDRSRVYAVRDISADMPYIQLRGRIASFEQLGDGRARRIVAHFTDGTGFVDLVWFQGVKFVLNKYKVQEEYIVFGKPTVYKGRVNIAHPDVEPAKDFVSEDSGLKPFYNTTELMKRSFLNSRAIEKLITTALKSLKEPIPETLPDCVVTANHLVSLNDAIKNIHFPKNSEALKLANYRLKFEELFYVQLNILKYANDNRRKYKGLVFKKVGDLFNSFFKDHLSFSLTEAQKRVLREIRKDMGTGIQMNRLLQGDVGSGKTVVALMSMLLALDNGYQACMMAPTEILANQHYDTIIQLLGDMNVKVELLTGSVTGKKREKILAELKNGEIDIIVGTHALLEDTVTFLSLGLAIVDEQHRFGVAQRAKLWLKNVCPPHILVMTATPIPRTLAMTLYGDLDVSVIDELPPGRKPIATFHQFDNRRAEINLFIRKQINLGHQVYVVYPLVKESEKIDLKNLEEGYVQVCDAFPDVTVCKVHGQMKSQEKESQMEMFVSGKAQIMVATTVIEVGVNVPNASAMVIENAERFGLSQLHQLRGRVGRGAEQSFCLLVTGFKLADNTRKRIEIMVRSNDGFEIAEADLRLRGPGDLEGTQQSGVAIELKIADLAHDGQILQQARTVAEKLLSSGVKLSDSDNAMLEKQLYLLRKTNTNWSAIS